MEKTLWEEMDKIDCMTGDRAKVSVKYVSSRFLGNSEDGIKVVINRLSPDRNGNTVPLVLNTTYPSSLDGLNQARDDALRAVENLYRLPSGLSITDKVINSEHGINFGMEPNRFYRLDQTEALKLIGSLN